MKEDILVEAMVIAVTEGRFHIAGKLFEAGVRFPPSERKENLISKWGMDATFHGLSEETRDALFDNIIGDPEQFPGKNAASLIYHGIDKHVIPLVKWTLKRIDDPNAVVSKINKDKDTLIHCAARKYSTDSLSAIISVVKNIDVLNLDGMTPLSVIQKKEHAKLLLDAGADVSITLPCGVSVQEHVISNVPDSLHHFAARTDDKTSFSISGRGPLGELKKKHKSLGVDIDTRGELGDTALFNAFTSCQTKNAQWLLEQGADPLLELPDGRTPLGSMLATPSSGKGNSRTKKALFESIWTSLNEEQKEKTVGAYFRHLSFSGSGKTTPEALDIEIVRTVLAKTGRRAVDLFCDDMLKSLEKPGFGQGTTQVKERVVELMVEKFPHMDISTKKKVGDVLTDQFAKYNSSVEARAISVILGDQEYLPDEDTFQKISNRSNSASQQRHGGTRILLDTLSIVKTRIEAKKLSSNISGKEEPGRRLSI